MPKFKVTPVAESIPFEPTEDISADNVQDAVSGGVNTALNTPRYSINCIHNGTVSNGTFIGYLNTIPGDSTPIVIPVKSDFVEYTFSNSNSNADFTLEFRKGSTTATPFHTISKVDTLNFVDIITPEEFLTGEEIYIKYVDDGTNASDVGLVLFFKALP